jgi:hypothetical protein
MYKYVSRIKELGPLYKKSSRHRRSARQIEKNYLNKPELPKLVNPSTIPDDYWNYTYGKIKQNISNYNLNPSQRESYSRLNTFLEEVNLIDTNPPCEKIINLRKLITKSDLKIWEFDYELKDNVIDNPCKDYIKKTRSRFTTLKTYIQKKKNKGTRKRNNVPNNIPSTIFSFLTK